MKALSPSASAQTRGLAMAVASFVFLAAVQPFVWALVSLSAETLHSKRSEEEQYNNLKLRVEDVSMQAEQRQEDLRELVVSFPPARNLAQIVERVEALAERSAVTVEIAGISEGAVIGVRRKADSGIIPVTVSIRASGSAGQLFEYLQALEHTPEVTTVNSWSLEPQRPSAQQPASHNLIMNVVFYLQQENNG